MNASYQMRLLLQCFNAFFCVHLVLSFAMLGLTPFVTRYAERIRPALAIRVALSLRLFPVAVALYAAIAIALPSYLLLEPGTEPERTSFWSICLAVLAVCIWIGPLVETASALRRASQFLERALRFAQSSTIKSNPVWLTRNPTPQIAMAGLFRSRLLLSESAVGILSCDELEVVLRHERAHERSRDNLKRLLLLILPDALPFVNFGLALERACKRFAEWAADDYASAGDPRNSASLASAIVTFARHQNGASVSPLATSLVDDTSDLARRVERLLKRPASATPPQARMDWTSALLIAASTVLFAGIVHFADFSNAHRLLEVLSH